MPERDSKLQFKPRVELLLKDGRELFFWSIKLNATPVGVMIIDPDKPQITKISRRATFASSRSPQPCRPRRSSGFTAGHA